MKKLCAITLVFLLCFSLVGCNKSDENAVLLSLKTLSCLNNIDFDSTYTEVSLHKNESYFFSNRNKEFFEKFTAFMSERKPITKADRNTDTEHIYISVNDGKNTASFCIYQDNVIEIFDLSKSYLYTCDNIYNEFKNIFEPYLEENKKYCSTVINNDSHTNEYAIYDKNGNLLQSDTTSEQPHLFYNSGIVHLWVQTGTGILTRWAKFYNTENGQVSPEYHGQTDFYGNMVCCAESSQVSVYDMFSGEEIAVFNSFEKPLGDCIENICSAYFTSNGTKVTVEYLNSDFKTEKQTFNLPYYDRLFSVLNSQTAFIDETGKSTYLKDFAYGEDEITTYFATPQEYTFLDLNGDGICELIADITPNKVFYIVFHIYSDDIYGFLVGRRSLQSLKEDGSFIATGGAETIHYCKMEFNKNSYTINNISVSLPEWQLKKDVIWHKFP